jgi:hypothetical protein
MIVGDRDVVCPTDLALEAFNRAREPKRLELNPGGHFCAYTDQFDRAAGAATEWFTEHLQLAGRTSHRPSRRLIGRVFTAVGHLHFRSAAPRLAASCKYHVRRHNRLPCPRIERED